MTALLAPEQSVRRPLWPQLPGPLRLLLLTQVAFNVGFYLVVPFLAAHLEHDLHLAGWLIGVVLGLRTFSQQGLFVLGGAIADQVGIKRSIVVGCAIRVVGFVLLGLASSLPGVIGGVLLVGLAAALFSPATESAIAAWAGDLERAGGPPRTEVLALETVCGQAGSVIGPVLGGVLLGVPFRTTCLVAAAIFVGILLAHVRHLPTGCRAGEPTRVGETLATLVRHRGFLAFAVLSSTALVSYAMLYLALPVELQRIGAPSSAITWFFVLAAVLTIALQVPVTRATGTWSIERRLVTGHALHALCFVPVALAAPWVPSGGMSAYAAPVLMVVLLHLGSMLTGPVVRDVVARTAHERRLGAYLGALASLGGLAVLVVSSAVGGLLDLARSPAPGAWIPWAVLAALPAASAAGMPAVLRRLPAATATDCLSCPSPSTPPLQETP
ncbi:MFS transporter [Arsenicicoccus dermatophilus]|uniref:MFS transporter n=1 Tax=Arsenicicoccus dermatophilus TaxID=1076331 RepID=UPI001F4D1E32|nr:MFS transporter [Arsenicicoccus dermatophilus]MCH8611841.1 MFS transporter [Arsenicicoccus dermatophilus]